MSKPNYLLQMLFDAGQINSVDLESRVRAAISGHDSQVGLKVETTGVGPLMSLQGPLSQVDECHHQINSKLLGAEPLSCVRLVDEAGDEVRCQAYPILASIEQRLRAFVNRKAVEVLGFGWWSRYAPEDLQNKVNSYVRKDVGVTMLEGTQFDDLVDLITHEYSEWPSDKSLSVAELNELMAGCASFEEFQNQLAAKTARFSFWDKVFAPFFSDLKQWEKVKSGLKFIINERHKVMHHRPMRLATVAVLATKEQEITALLGTSKLTLTEPEREKVQQDIQQVILASEKAHRAEVDQLWRSFPVDISKKRFYETFRQHQQQWLQAVLPSPEELADLEQTIRSTMPSKEELDRMAEQVKAATSSALPTPEEIKQARDRVKHVVEQSDLFLNEAQRRHTMLPDRELLERMETIKKNIGPVKAMLEQFQKYQGR